MIQKHIIYRILCDYPGCDNYREDKANHDIDALDAFVNHGGQVKDGKHYCPNHHVKDEGKE